jgi:hypothetical protein
LKNNKKRVTYSYKTEVGWIPGKEKGHKEEKQKQTEKKYFVKHKK